MIKYNSNGSAITEDYNSVVREDNRDFLAKIVVDGTELTCAIQRITVEKGSCAAEDQFMVGDVISNKLEAILKGVESLMKGQNVEVRIGLLTGEDYEWVTIGKFTASSVKRTYYTTTVTGYGYASSKTNVPFPATENKTLAGIAAAIQTATGVPVVFDTGINTSLAVEKSMANLTCYGALKVLASVVGGYATDTYDGKIRIGHYSNSGTLEANTGMMVTLPNFEEEDHVVTGAKYIVQEAGESGLGTEVREISYSVGEPNLTVNDEYMSESLMANVEYLVGYSYRPADIELSLGDPRLEGDDVLIVTDIDGEGTLRSTQGVLRTEQGILRVEAKNHIIPCHQIIHTYDGGFHSQIRSVSNLDLGTQTELMTRLENAEKSIAESIIDIKDLQMQTDGKVETWAQASDPSTGWTAEERTAHTGDLWLYTGLRVITVNGVTIKPQGVYQYDASEAKWVAYSSTTDNLFDLADGKTTIFYGTTSESYDADVGDYLVDNSDGSTYRWSGTAWVKQTDYTTAINESIEDLRETLEAQIDAKVETWVQTSNPAATWSTAVLKAQHNGDLWLYTGLSTITVNTVSIKPQGVYQYNSTTGKWVAYSSTTNNLFDLADGKTAIFYGTPSGAYSADVGDYLVDSESNITYRWDGTQWTTELDVSVAAENTYQFYISTAHSGSEIIYTAHLLQDGEDVTDDIASDIEWFLKTPDGFIYLDTSDSITIDTTDEDEGFNYGQTVTAVWTKRDYRVLKSTQGILRCTRGILRGYSEV